MIDAYMELFTTVKNSVEKLGFSLIQDSEFIAIFGDGSDWKILFEGERYVRPAFDLLVMLEGKREHCMTFSIRLLMEVFLDNRPPSLVNQLDFLEKHRADIFISPPPYEKQYKQINMLI